MQRVVPHAFQRLRHGIPKRRSVFILLTLLLIAFTAASNAEPGTLGGQTRLINNWTITPAGKQTPLGDLPLNSVLSPDGRFLLVSNGGAGIQSLQVVTTADSKVIQTLSYDAPSSVFIGLAYSPDGTKAYASGGGEEVVHTFTVSEAGMLTADGDITIGTSQTNPFPTGLSITPDGKTLYVANNLANNVSVVDTTTKAVTATIPIGSYPYTTLVSKDGKTIYASNWGDATISVIDADSGKVSATIPVGQHPTAMVLSKNGEQLFVTDGNSDAVSVVATDSNKETRKISVAPSSNSPLSSSPQGLALSRNGHSLYVVDAGNNEVVVINLEEDGDANVVGRIPTAWYPTSVNVSKNNDTLYVTNGKGLGAGPNDKGLYPNPTRTAPPIVDGVTGYNDKYCNCTFNNFTATMMQGTLSTIEVPGEERLALYTEQVLVNDHVNDDSVNERDANNPIPVPGGKSPIKHVIYIMKENRTYDQVFGDEQPGNGNPNLALFPRNNTPNLHALVDRFGILDNFYADAEVSADGHNWAMSANASDYNERIYPQDYSAVNSRNRGYDFEGKSAINLSPGGYLWDAAAQAKISYRDYGEFYQFDQNYPVSQAKLIPESQADTCTGPIAHSYTGVTVPAGQVLCFLPMNINAQVTPNLVGHIDPRYRTYDNNYREVDRIAEWQREFNQFVANGNLPQLEIMRISNDHTQGTTPGKLTPQAEVAENDNAVGRLVDILSHSKYWADTAVFVTEDDAQNGPDHVDAHRTESLVISPYTSRNAARVDHTQYDTVSMVRTMELILGLEPLSQYDAHATPMWRLFSSKADKTPYSALPSNIPTTNINGAQAFGAQASALMDFSQEDRAPTNNLNEILWHAIKGADTPYPGTSGSTSTAGPDSDG